jgi:hypothetical protein
MSDHDSQDDFFIIDDPFDMLELGLKFGPECPESLLVVPKESVLKPFFFMRLIQKSINEGAFITTDLFVPKHVWTLKTAQISNIDRKMQFFNDLKRELKPLSDLKNLTKNERAVDALVNFVVKQQDEIR